ncbi:MAG: TonB-dependent receptor [Thermoanaerobaculales bacterium]|jgi:iron complex outermembrane receptor protein|nr:TonB-dependent receptor [Thermoanaerobaculales bacterium]
MDTQSTGRLFRFMLLALVVLAIGLPAVAQEPAEAATDETEMAVMVGEITVTAQRREENIQEVPLALTALQGEDLETLMVGAPDVRILSGRVPSLVMESSFGRAFPRFYIRGLGNPDFDLNASQPVSMMVDEVVLENPVVKGMPLFDLDRVEVLRGPQGTLFGRNTPAGVVKFETRRPVIGDPGGSFRASYGTYGSFDVSGGVNVPVGDHLAMRFSALYQEQDDWIDNLYEPGPVDELGGHTIGAGRFQLLWSPTESFDALVNLHTWDVDGTARVFRANILKPGGGGLVDGFDQEEVYLDGQNSQDISSYGGSLRFDWDLGGSTLTSITAFEKIDNMLSRGDIDGGFGAVYAPPSGPGFIPFASESADGIPDLDQFTQELRLASNGNDTLDWIFGAFYFDEDFQADTYSFNSLAPGNPRDGYAFQTQQSTSYALFGSLDFHLGERWDLQAGIRYTDDEKDFSAERPDPTFQLPTFAPITRHTEDDNVSWNLSATYKPSSDVNVYGRVATGFRAPSIQGRILFCADFEGGLNPATNCVSVADSEDILSFELGAKTILADNRLRLNLAAYWFEVSDQQITAVGGEYNTATLLNADKTEGHGLEADIEWTPSGRVLMTFGASWNPTEIKDPNLTVAACGGGCTMNDPVVGGLAFIDGNPLPHAPEIVFNGIINFRSNPVHKGLFATLDWAYYSEKNFFLYESEEFQDDSFEVGLRLGYGWNFAKYEIALFSRNLLDEEIVRGGIDFNNLTGFTNDPRIIGVEFVGRF